MFDRSASPADALDFYTQVTRLCTAVPQHHAVRLPCTSVPLSPLPVPHSRRVACVRVQPMWMRIGQSAAMLTWAYPCVCPVLLHRGYHQGVGGDCVHPGQRGCVSPDLRALHIPPRPSSPPCPSCSPAACTTTVASGASVWACPPSQVRLDVHIRVTTLWLDPLRLISYLDFSWLCVYRTPRRRGPGVHCDPQRDGHRGVLAAPGLCGQLRSSSHILQAPHAGRYFTTVVLGNVSPPYEDFFLYRCISRLTSHAPALLVGVPLWHLRRHGATRHPTVPSGG